MEVKNMMKNNKIKTTKGDFYLLEEGKIGGKKDEQKYKIYVKEAAEVYEKVTKILNKTPESLENRGRVREYMVGPKEVLRESGVIEKNLLMGYDCEWDYTSAEELHIEWDESSNSTKLIKNLETKRDVVSYQFYFVAGGYEVGILLINTSISPNGLTSTSVFKNLTQVIEKVFKLRGRELKITLVAHYGVFDISCLSDSQTTFFSNHRSIIKGKSFSTTRAIKIPKIYSCNRNKIELEVSVRDSAMLGGQGSLARLGESLNLQKLDNSRTLSSGKKAIEAARLWMNEYPEEFDGYALSDAMISYEWLSQGFSEYSDDWSNLPRTIAGLAEERAFKAICEINNFNLTEYNKKFRGLSSDKVCKTKGTITSKLSYELSIMDSVMFAASAVFGGYNASFTNGLHKGKTYDYDIRGAYPTSMSILKDLDFSVTSSMINSSLHLSSFSPDDYIVGLVKFRFPNETRFPSIPIRDSLHGLIHPRRSDVAVIASAPEIYAALLQGAEVTPIKLFRMNTTDNKTLRKVMKAGVEKREEAKKQYGKGSAQDVKEKLTNNSTAGKFMQGVIENTNFSVNSLETEEIGPSKLTNPYIAMMLTGLVRAFLTLTLEEIEKRGYKVFSITTDGFISNIPPEELEKIRIPKFTDLFEEAEEYLTGDRTIFEVKHSQDTLINVKTRGNIGLNINEDGNGVFALASYQMPREIRVKTPEEQKRYFTKLFLKRDNEENQIVSIYNRMPSMREYILKNKDFIGEFSSVNVNFEFDWKRIPVNARMETLELDGEVLEVLTFDTRPVETFEEFEFARAVVNRNRDILKTTKDLNDMFFKIEMAKVGARNVENVERTKANQILRNIRSGALTTTKTSDEVIEALNNYYNINLTRKAWNDAGRDDRQSIMIDYIYLIDDIRRMGL